MGRRRPRRGEPRRGRPRQGETAQERCAPADGDGPPGDPAPALVQWHEILLVQSPVQRRAGGPAGDPRGVALTPGEGKKTVRPTLRVPWRTRRPTPGETPPPNHRSHSGRRLGPPSARKRAFAGTSPAFRA